MKIKKFVSWLANGDEMIVINTNTQKCLVLSKTGREIWELLIINNKFQSVIEVLKTRYQISEWDLIVKDTFELIDLLEKYDIIDMEEDFCEI